MALFIGQPWLHRVWPIAWNVPKEETAYRVTERWEHPSKKYSLSHPAPPHSPPPRKHDLKGHVHSPLYWTVLSNKSVISETMTAHNYDKLMCLDKLIVIIQIGPILLIDKPWAALLTALWLSHWVKVVVFVSLYSLDYWVCIWRMYNFTELVE